VVANYGTYRSTYRREEAHGTTQESWSGNM